MKRFELCRLEGMFYVICDVLDAIKLKIMLMVSMILDSVIIMS